MNDNRLTDNMTSCNEDPEILVYKIHIIGQITELLINIKSLTEEIYTTMMMPLITKPFDNFRIHLFEVTIIPNKADFIYEYTTFFGKVNVEDFLRIINVKKTRQLLSGIYCPSSHIILICKLSK